MQLKRRISWKAVPCALLVGALSFSPAVPAVAFAETGDTAAIQSELDAARTRLKELTKQLEIAQATVFETSDQLDETKAEIEQLKADIAAKEAELSQAQAELSDNVVSSYKKGNASIVEMLLSSQTFSELTSRVFYANKVSAIYNDQIESVNAAMFDALKKEYPGAYRCAQKISIVFEQYLGKPLSDEEIASVF